MQTEKIIVGKVLTPEGIIESGLIRIQGSIIQEVSERGSYNGPVDLDAGDQLITPGFIDIHNHGALYNHFMTSDQAGIHEALQYHMRHGTTSLLATTTTADNETIEHGLRTLSSVMKEQQEVRSPERGATVLGVHIEGPYLNPARAGAQNLGLVRLPNVSEYQGWEKYGIIRMITLAPEMNGAEPLIRYIRDNSHVLISAGHTDASYDEITTALDWGLSHCTHFTNAMSGFRECEPGVFEPGTVGAGLLHPELTVELIADGTHIHPAILKLIYKVKGADHVALITDAVQFCGLPDGEYVRGPKDDRLVVVKQGIIRMKSNQVLAGSGLTMNRAAKKLADLGVPLMDVWKMAAAVPARLIGVDDRKGLIRPGMDADLIVIDDAFQVKSVMIEGDIMRL